MAVKSTCITTIISVSHIAKFWFFIEVHFLEPKWYEVSLTSEFQHIAIYVKYAVPNYLTLAAKSLYRRTQVVLHDGITIILGELCHRCITTTVIHPCNEVGMQLLPVIADAPEFIFLHSRLFPPVIAPLMQQHVAVPGIAMACVVRLFKGTPAQGIVLKPYDGTIGRAYALEHAVAVPLVGGISLLPAIMSLQLLVIEGTKTLRVLLILPKRSLFRWQSPKTTIVTINCFF